MPIINKDTIIANSFAEKFIEEKIKQQERLLNNPDELAKQLMRDLEILKDGEQHE